MRVGSNGNVKFRETRKSFYVDTFGVMVSVHITNDVGRVLKQIEAETGLTVPVNGSDWSALCVYGDGGFFRLVFDSDQLNVRALAHETFHLTSKILDHLNIRLGSSPEAEETGAYLHEYLFDRILQIVSKAQKNKREAERRTYADKNRKRTDKASAPKKA
jgi:hypothetical protein